VHGPREGRGAVGLRRIEVGLRPYQRCDCFVIATLDGVKHAQILVLTEQHWR
jgi:hypothetical protein